MKTQILTDEQFNNPANQNRDNAIIGYRSIETETKPLNITPVINQVCDCEKHLTQFPDGWRCTICWEYWYR